jgi:hypothetical protein
MGDCVPEAGAKVREVRSAKGQGASTRSMKSVAHPFKYCLGMWSKRASLVDDKDFGAVVPGLESVIFSSEYLLHTLTLRATPTMSCKSDSKSV